MSGAPDAEETVHSAVPIPDLSAIDQALGGDDLRDAFKRVRPADLGRDLSRRPVDEAVELFGAVDDRRAAAMLKAAHHAVAAHVLEAADSARAAHVLTFLPTDDQAHILAAVSPEARTKLEAAL